MWGAMIEYVDGRYVLVRISSGSQRSKRGGLQELSVTQPSSDVVKWKDGLFLGEETSEALSSHG